MDMRRRDFFKTAALALFAAPVLGSIFASGSAFAADDFVKESDPLAKSLNYCADAEKGKAKVCPNRKDPTKKDQLCDGCQFYAADGKDKGKCQILQNKLVKAKGWCNSWVKKA